MKLSKCTYGKIVIATSSGRVGMIKGITNTGFGDKKVGIDHAIPLVEWSDGETFGIHEANIEEFKE